MTTQDNRVIDTAATVTVAEPPAEPAPPRKAKRPYLYQVDLFRIITFACVVADHVVSGSSGPDDVRAKSAELLLHFTREAFFALTGFVLIYQYMDRPITARAFWRRRFMAIGIPYVIWSVLYWVYSISLGNWSEPLGAALRRLVFDLATGQAWYQMYFLFVTMQVYLLFPLLMRLLRATEGYHRWVLAVSAALEVGFLYLWVYPPAFDGTAADLWNHMFIVFVPYQFYIVLGAVAAWHFETLQRVVRRFGVWFVVAAVVTTVLAELEYVRSVHHGMPAEAASQIFLPHLIIFFVTVILGQYTLCCWWRNHRKDGSLVARAVTYGADRSFGVFLAHPFALQLIAPYIIPWQHTMGMVWTMVVVYAIVMTISLAIAETVRRIPGSLWLTGRPMIRTDFTPITRRTRAV